VLAVLSAPLASRDRTGPGPKLLGPVNAAEVKCSATPSAIKRVPKLGLMDAWWMTGEPTMAKPVKSIAPLPVTTTLEPTCSTVTVMGDAFAAAVAPSSALATKDSHFIVSSLKTAEALNRIRRL